MHWITAFWIGTCMSILFTLDMVYQVTQVGLDPLQLVLVGTALEATIFICEVPTGVVADLRSRRLSVITGVLLTGLGFLVEGTWPIFWVVLLAQVLWGLGWTFISGAREAWIADEVGEDRLRDVLLRATQFGQLGALVGVPISVALGSIRLSLPLLAGGGLYLLLGLFLALWMPEEGFLPTPPEERDNWRSMVGTLRDGVRLVRGRRVLVMFVIIGLFVGLYSEGYDRLWTAHLLESFSFPALASLSTEAWFGIIRLGGLLITLCGAEIVRRRANHDGSAHPARTLQVVHGLMVLSLVALAATQWVGLAMVAIWAFEALRDISYPLQQAWINQHIDSRVRATVLSMTGQVDALGQMVGGPMIGIVGAALSIRAAIGTAALLLAPVVPLYGHAHDGQRRRRS